MQITVEHGRLSVALRNADVSQVLAQIGQQSGIMFRMGPGVKGTLSVQFADVELDEGLRRLLRLVSLSSVIVRAQNTTGTRTIKEVQVFGETQGNPSLQPMVAQAQTPPSPPASGGENDAASRLREALERAREQAPQPPAGENDAASRLREALERARDQALPPPAEGNSDVTNRLRDALGGAQGGQEPRGNQ
jgi:hypothetical protein